MADGGSLLPTSCMTAAEQKHNVLKLSKRVFVVFVNKPNTGVL